VRGRPVAAAPAARRLVWRRDARRCDAADRVPRHDDGRCRKMLPTVAPDRRHRMPVPSRGGGHDR